MMLTDSSAAQPFLRAQPRRCPPPAPRPWGGGGGRASWARRNPQTTMRLAVELALGGDVSLPLPVGLTFTDAGEGRFSSS